MNTFVRSFVLSDDYVIPILLLIFSYQCILRCAFYPLLFNTWVVQWVLSLSHFDSVLLLLILISIEIFIQFVV